MTTTTPLTSFGLGMTMRTTPGRCAMCAADATVVLRATTRLGIAATARSCEAHEGPVRSALWNLSADSIDRSVARRYRRTAERAVHRAQGRAGAFGRTSASLSGASSLTHTYALLSDAAAAEAEGWAEILRIAADDLA